MTVGLVVVSHSARLAEGVAELAGQMTQSKVAIAPAGGTANDELGTSVERIEAAISSVYGPDGVVVLLDLGSAILSTEMALEMLDDEQRTHVRLSAAPLVEGAVAAALEASLGRSLAEVQQAAEKTASKEQLALLKPLSETENSAPAVAPTTPTPSATGQWIEAQLTLTNPTGLHARPASLFVQTANRFSATIQLLKNEQAANATSIMEILSLAARQGDTILLRASGPDAQAAIEELSKLVRANFYETPAEATTTPAAPTQEKVVSQPQEQKDSWQGVTTSKGAALGPAFLYTSASLSLKTIERKTIAPEQVDAEQERLRQAVNAAISELQNLVADLQKTVGSEQAAIFEAHAMMLDDPTLLDDALQRIQQQHLSAACALAEAGEEQAQTLESLGDTLIAARAVDVRDAVSRAIRHLGDSGVSLPDLSTLTTPVILLAHDLTPSDTARLHPETILGICTTQGGPTAHAAILARALGIPAIAGIDESALQAISAEDEVGLDADQGILYRHPSPEIRATLTRKMEERRREQAALKESAQQAQQPLYIGKQRIHLLANVGSEAEAKAAREWGAEGIGLLRTEFLFASAMTLPNEEEQRQQYIRLFRAFSGEKPDPTKPIIARTLDAGADKPMPALNAVLGEHVEANPALGLRGIRIHLAHPELLEQQLAALLRAAGEVGIALHIMFPMITTVEELREARSIFDRAYQRLREQQVAVPEHVPVGIMVEVPAAGLLARELAELADFFSIGANDLMQYTLATDRTNPTLTHLYHPMQPAVLRLIRLIAEAGKAAGKPVAVCGEIASDPRIAPLLVGMGVHELSMAPTALPTIRKELSGWSPEDLAQLVEKVSKAKTVADVEQARDG
ncbi:MAG TPA: phosphoenolpyruvate--protein phosphotransferase [Ktedonobacteraceae bacterium]|nr:phosphoenolpyruvate--protein phosphotransferase [Ktedonobacteraceae bacterium]